MCMYIHISIYAGSCSLSQGQLQAVQHALRCRVSLIQGPPGCWVRAALAVYAHGLESLSFPACRHREDLHRLQASADAGGQVADPGPHIQERCPGRIPRAVPKGPAFPARKGPQAFVLSCAHACRPKVSCLCCPHMKSCSYPACM